MKKITVNKSDEVVVIVEKIIESDDKDVVLSVPRFSHIGESLSNFHLLKREADALDKKIVVESVDDHVIELAEMSGLKAVNPFFVKNKRQFSDIVVLKKEKTRKEKISSDIFPREELVDNAADEEESGREDYGFPKTGMEKPVKRSFLKSFFSGWSLPKFNFNKRFFVYFLIIAALVCLGVAAAKILPKAKVVIVAQTKDWAYKDSIIADKSAVSDISKMSIPAQVFSQKKNVNLKFAATGKKQVEKKASGKIIVYNSYSSDPQPLVENTRFITPEGKLFRLAKTITVPGAKISEGKIIASSIETGVVADQAGPDYNIGPVKLFTIPGLKGTPKYQAFYGESTGNMVGGFIGEVAYPTSDDIKKAKTEAGKSLEEVLNTTLLAQNPKDFKIVDGARDYKTISQKVDENVDENGQFGIFSEAQASIIVFQENHLKDLLAKRAKKEGGEDFDLRSSTLEYGIVRADFAKGILSFPVDFKAVLARHIDIEDLKSKILGKSENDLKIAIFSLPGLKSATISLWPFWVKTVPNSLDKITVVVE